MSTPASVDDLLTEADRHIRDLMLDPLPPHGRQHKGRDDDYYTEVHLRVREHTAAWPALAAASRRLLDATTAAHPPTDVLHRRLNAIAARTPSLDAPEARLTRAATLMDAAADLAHSARPDQLPAVAARAAGLIDVAARTTTIWLASLPRHREGDRRRYPGETQLRQDLARIGDPLRQIHGGSYAPLRRAGADIIATDARTPGLAGVMTRWHESARTLLDGRALMTLRPLAQDLALITAATAKLIETANTAGLVDPAAAGATATAMQEAYSAWLRASTSWPPHPLAPAKQAASLHAHHELGQELYKEFRAIADPDGPYQQPALLLLDSPAWLRTLRTAAVQLDDIAARIPTAIEQGHAQVPTPARALMTQRREAAQAAGQWSILTDAEIGVRDLHRNRFIPAVLGIDAVAQTALTHARDATDRTHTAVTALAHTSIGAARFRPPSPTPTLTPQPAHERARHLTYAPRTRDGHGHSRFRPPSPTRGRP